MNRTKHHRIISIAPMMDWRIIGKINALFHQNEIYWKSDWLSNVLTSDQKITNFSSISTNCQRFRYILVFQANNSQRKLSTQYWRKPKKTDSNLKWDRLNECKGFCRWLGQVPKRANQKNILSVLAQTRSDILGVKARPNRTVGIRPKAVGEIVKNSFLTEITIIWLIL